jgi:flagellar motor protein MotB
MNTKYDNLGLVVMITMALALVSAVTLKAEEKSDTGQPLSETVEYEVKEKLDIQKPAPDIRLEIKDIIDSGTPQTDSVLEETRPIPSDADFEHYAMLDSDQILKPWNPLIPEPPLVTFQPGLSKVATKRWEFKVSDQRGEVVKTIEGKGVPPKEFKWDGRNERGEFITVGTIYSYQFVTYDEHENAHTFPGEPFGLDALMYKQKRDLSIEFANGRLFSDDSAEFRPSMRGFWGRAIDVIRQYSNKPLTVEVHSDSVKSPLAEERRQAIIQSISDATNIPGVDIRHKIVKATDRGNVTRLVMFLK